MTYLGDDVYLAKRANRWVGIIGKKLIFLRYTDEEIKSISKEQLLTTIKHKAGKMRSAGKG